MRKHNQKGNMVSGMLIGVTVAVIALGGAYWFFNKQKTNYTNLEKNQEFAKQSANLESSQTETLTPAGAAANVPEFHPVDRPPVAVSASTENVRANNGNIAWSEPAVASRDSNQGKQPSVAANGTKPADTSKTPQPPAKKDENIKQVAKRSYLQTGAFKDASQAEEQRAQLALMGVKAEVQAIDLGGNKGVFHRVRVGPFTNEAQMKKTQTALQGNNIKSNIVTPN